MFKNGYQQNGEYYITSTAMDDDVDAPPSVQYKWIAREVAPVQQDQTYDIEEEEEHKENPAQPPGKRSTSFRDRFDRSSRLEHELLEGADIVPGDQPEQQSHTDGGDNANETEDVVQENGGETRSTRSPSNFRLRVLDIFGEEQFEEET